MLIIQLPGYFAGEPPVDELEILRGQVQLLHNQLLYERHKCELHAIRNRRLIGKTFKAVQFQEELLATVSTTYSVGCLSGYYVCFVVVSIQCYSGCINADFCTYYA